MSLSYNSFSTPALRKLSHQNYTCTTSFAQVLAPRVLPERRVIVAVQNKSATAVLEVIFDTTGSAGLLIPPNQTISLENYNGTVLLKSDTAGSIAHIAVGSV
jgi:hypothetical protein